MGLEQIGEREQPTFALGRHRVVPGRAVESLAGSGHGPVHVFGPGVGHRGDWLSGGRIVNRDTARRKRRLALAGDEEVLVGCGEMSAKRVAKSYGISHDCLQPAIVSDDAR